MTLCTLKSTVFFFALFILVDATFLTLGISNLYTDALGDPNAVLKSVGGYFGLLASFLAWYIMYAGVADNSNR